MRAALLILLAFTSSAFAQAPPCRDHACSNDSLTPPVVGDERAVFDIPFWPDCDGTASADLTWGRLERWEVVVLATGQTPDQGITCHTETFTRQSTPRRGEYDAWRYHYDLAWLPPVCFPDPGIMTRTMIRLWWSCKGGPLTSTVPSNEVWNWISWQGQPYAWLDVDAAGQRCERRMSTGAPRRFTMFPECV